MQRLPVLEYAKAEIWEKMWNERDPPFWHKPDVHPELVKHYNDWTGGRKTLRLFVPLCGKSVDMLWLAAQGHTVVGVELVEKAVEEFFTENNLAYEVRNERQTLSPKEPVLKAYCSTNKQEKDITIFVCDIFQFINSRPKNKFDGIWDRGLVAIILSKDDRVERYVQGLLAMLALDGRYFTETFRHDIDEHENKVQIIANVTENKMKELFGDRCNLRQVDVKTLDKADPEAKGRPHMAHSMIYHIITFKRDDRNGTVHAVESGKYQ